MSIFAIGDLHLSFSSDKPMDIFGAEWTNHSERLKEEWVSAIGSDDTVIIVGDISWALKLPDAMPDIKWIHDLPGKKVLIRGNHDLWWNSIGKLNSLYEDILFLQNTHYQTEGVAICGSRGWITDPDDPEFTESDERIYRRELIRMEMSLKSAAGNTEGDIIVAIHFPPASKNNKPTDFTDLFERYGVKKVVYGHLHGEDAYKKGITGEYNGIDYDLVSLDYLNCKPLRIWN